MILIFFVICTSTRAALLPGFHSEPKSSEQVRWLLSTDAVRIYFNAEADFNLQKPVELIVYLLPNGSTIEQTLGKRLAPGDDWRFDIQHIGAQVRLLRHLDPAENIVLCCLEAPGRSWPRYRADHADNPRRIRNLFATVAGVLPPTAKLRIALAAHSGGGSFLFGYLNSGAINDAITRIIFLDADYSYSDQLHHGDKLIAWLRRSPANHLIVFAYDDRNVTFDGKKIVSDTGGTWRASQRMIARFSKEQKPESGNVGPFLHRSFFAGQAQFFLHPNPQLKILHTAMIGEMNAFLHAMTLGTRYQNKYGALGGPRAYTKWVTPDPAAHFPITMILNLPPRPKTAPSGSMFLKTIENLSTDQREQLVIHQILTGNIPDFLRTLCPINVQATDSDGITHSATYYVTPDVLAIGSDRDFFRMPLTPISAQHLAEALDCSLITRKISDDVYASAAVKLAPMPLTIQRESPDTFYQSNQLIESERKGYALGLLVAGIKKDVVLTNRLKGHEGHVAIYGWQKFDGKPIQPLYVGHLETYVDYSHGIRLIADAMFVDGKTMTVKNVLADPKLCGLISDEGPIIPAKYSPATRPSTAPSAQPHPK